MRRVASSLAALVALTSFGTVAPAGAGVPESFNELFLSIPITVNGSYTPLVGKLDCTAGDGDFAIIWYAPGTSADWRWQDVVLDEVEPSLDHTTESLSVNGIYEPFVGDFDGDGCDDVFWYAPGSAADFVWYGVDGGGFTTRAVSVNGDYVPLVGTWDDALGDDIFWYSAGGGTESIWRGSPTRGSFGMSAAPQVSGTDYRAASFGGGVLFHRPGPGPDYLWSDILAGASAPGESTEVTINRTYQPYFVGGFLLYGPGTAKDTFVYDISEDGDLSTLPGTINGTYTVGVSAPGPGGIAIFHAPGSAQDYFWAGGGGGGATLQP